MPPHRIPWQHPPGRIASTVVTAKTDVDHALADKVNVLGQIAIANAIRQAETHEAVDEWRTEIADLASWLNPSMRRVCPRFRSSSRGLGGGSS